MTYHLTTLPCGLRVATETLPGAESVAVVVHVDVGTRHENPATNGISHLLEHMAFKGTSTRSARQIAESFDNVGGQVNAYTSMEHTVYYARVLKEHTELATDILCDILQHSSFEDSELTREKDVILQEIAMNRDSPDDMIVDYFDATAFPGQPLGYSILGNEQNVSAFTRTDVKQFMTTHYSPGNMAISAAGQIEHDRFVRLVEKYFSMEHKPPPAPCVSAHYQGGDTRMQKELEQLHLIMGLPAVTIHDDRYYAFQLYANILGGGMSSRLFQEVREKRGLAYDVYASSAAYADCGVLSVYAGTAPERAGELTAVLCDQLVHMAHEVNDNELARAKNQLKSSLLMTRENPQNVAMWIARHLIVFGHYRTADELRRRIDNVTTKDIEDLGALLLNGKLTLAAYGPAEHVLPYESLQKRLTG
ncbi:MAG: M16 family metallopeptidase [Alphaproteobacteria bacterium]